MDNDSIKKLIKASIIVANDKSERTITPKNLQTAFRILYMNHDHHNQSIFNACRYVTKYTGPDYEKNYFKRLGETRKLVKTIVNQLPPDNPHINYKIGNLTPVYLLGIIDTFNNQLQMEQINYNDLDNESDDESDNSDNESDDSDE